MLLLFRSYRKPSTASRRSACDKTSRAPASRSLELSRPARPRLRSIQHGRLETSWRLWRQPGGGHRSSAHALARSKGRAGPRAAGLLTQREIEVLRLLGEGLTNAEIAARLFISPKTAEHHASRIFAKLGVTKRSEAAAYAARHLEAE